MINFVRKPQYGYEDLLEIIRLLRSEDGCPWDKAQTHQSIRRGLLEEAYEAAEAIDNDDPVLLKEELGDVLMQVVFHADIEADAGRFTIDDVCDGVVKKLLFRHPHVFGSECEDSPESVPVSWDKLKRQEKGQKTVADSMDSVARSLPGLWRAEKLQNKAASAGFEWPDVQGALDKLEEEVAELRRAVEESGDVPEELGDVLMQVVFHADIESDAGRFTIDDVCDGVVKKLLFRHPHVFGSQCEDSPESVPVSWDKLKRQEKGQKTVADSMDSVARSLPGLWRAEKLQSKAASAGFEWPDVQGALDKLEEEVAELRRAVEEGGDVPEELGDVLFAAVKVGRFCACDPEDAVNGTCEKFIRRFRAVENGAAAQGREVSQLSLEEMTALWNEAKRS